MIKNIDSRNETLFDVPKSGIGAELGVHRGDFSVTLYHTCKPKLLYLVDLWEPMFPQLGYYRWDSYESLVGKKFEEEIKNGLVKLVKSRTVDFLRTLSDSSLDWVYLDSDHTYLNTQDELREIHRVLKPSGIIMGHDLCTEPKAWGTGVPRAVLEFVQDRKMTIESLTNEDYPTFFGRVIKQQGIK